MIACICKVGDLAAAEVALEPARAALAAGMHKTPAGSASEPIEAAERGSSMPFLMRYTAGWIYAAMATAGVSLLEKQRRYEDAAAELRQLLGQPFQQLLIHPPACPHGLALMASSSISGF